MPLQCWCRGGVWVRPPRWEGKAGVAGYWAWCYLPCPAAWFCAPVTVCNFFSLINFKFFCVALSMPAIGIVVVLFLFHLVFSHDVKGWDLYVFLYSSKHFYFCHLLCCFVMATGWFKSYPLSWCFAVFFLRCCVRVASWWTAALYASCLDVQEVVQVCRPTLLTSSHLEDWEKGVWNSEGH